jgi:hypothetical protein
MLVALLFIVGIASAGSLSRISLRIEVKMWCRELSTSSLLSSNDQSQKSHREGQAMDHAQSVADKMHLARPRQGSLDGEQLRVAQIPLRSCGGPGLVA